MILVSIVGILLVLEACRRVIGSFMACICASFLLYAYFGPHMPAMFALARDYFASDADAEDAVQDAFVKAYRALDRLRSPARFAAWLATVTRRTGLDILRATREKTMICRKQ